MSLASIIREKNQRLVGVPDKLLSQVEKTQRKIFTQILLLMEDFSIKDGKIELSTANLAVVDEIIANLRIALHGSDYFDAVKEFGKEFDTQGKINQSYFKQAFEDFKTSDIADAVLADAKVGAVERLIGASLDENFLRPAENLLSELVTSGAGWKESVEAIREFAEGSEQVDGKLLQYAKQIAHDEFAYADRAYTNAAAEEVEAEWYFYSGGEIPTTRCFCNARNNKYFHFREVEAWGRGEDLGECRTGDLWAGANRNTNEQTIFVYLGGHNCMHSLQPVSIFDVPGEVVQRNINNGNYEPTPFEIEELGL